MIKNVETVHFRNNDDCELLGSINLFFFFFFTQQHQEAWSRGTQVVANYNFEGSSPDDLPFKKGDVLTIVQPTKVGQSACLCDFLPEQVKKNKLKNCLPKY